MLVRFSKCAHAHIRALSMRLQLCLSKVQIADYPQYVSPKVENTSWLFRSLFTSNPFQMTLFGYLHSRVTIVDLKAWRCSNV